MSTAIQYVAEPTHVREVSLRGTADLDSWKDRLRKENLIPAEHDGKAQVLVMAATMKFMGIRFTEVSFTVGVSEPERGPRRDAAFLVQAFNSCRLFAFCERMLFATPYAHGECHVSVASPVSVRLLRSGADVFRAEMGGRLFRAPEGAPAQRGRRLGRPRIPARQPARPGQRRPPVHCQDQGPHPDVCVPARSGYGNHQALAGR